jgi:hypothetical protein
MFWGCATSGPAPIPWKGGHQSGADRPRRGPVGRVAAGSCPKDTATTIPKNSPPRSRSRSPCCTFAQAPCQHRGPGRGLLLLHLSSEPAAGPLATSAAMRGPAPGAGQGAPGWSAGPGDSASPTTSSRPPGQLPPGAYWPRPAAAPPEPDPRLRPRWGVNAKTPWPGRDAPTALIANPAPSLRPSKRP